jgi:septum formation protein
MHSPNLILASSSIYRKQLLMNLQLPFSIIAPDIDETPLLEERAEDTAYRLAVAKAHKVGSLYPDALIIGSDQVATLEGMQLGKPMTFDNAVRQLQIMRGKTVAFHTALCLFNPRSDRLQTEIVPCNVKFRDLSDEHIVRYLAKEQPFNCSAGAKVEGLGIALIEKIEGGDPNALIGLPLISLVDMLRNEGVEVF